MGSHMETNIYRILRVNVESVNGRIFKGLISTIKIADSVLFESEWEARYHGEGEWAVTFDPKFDDDKRIEVLLMDLLNKNKKVGGNTVIFDANSASKVKLKSRSKAPRKSRSKVKSSPDPEVGPRTANEGMRAYGFEKPYKVGLGLWERLKKGETVLEIAASIGKARRVVDMLLALKKIHPKLRSLIDLPMMSKDRISILMANELARVFPERQVEIWEQAKKEASGALVFAKLRELSKEHLAPVSRMQRVRIKQKNSR